MFTEEDVKPGKLFYWLDLRTYDVHVHLITDITTRKSIKGGTKRFVKVDSLENDSTYELFFDSFVNDQEMFGWFNNRKTALIALKNRLIDDYKNGGYMAPDTTLFTTKITEINLTLSNYGDKTKK